MSNEEVVQIKPANIQTVIFTVTGTAPYVQHAFSGSKREEIMRTQAAGAQARSRRKREPKDFEALFQGAIHYSEDGWIGIPAPAFRSCMIHACRLCGFKMTIAKLAIFIEPDGFDREDGTPLVKIDGPDPERHEASVRNATGVIDIRVRPMWRKWGVAELRVRFDADLFSVSDVANLLNRGGLQVGIGEGRPGSKSSHGQGWGTFQTTDRKEDA